MKRALKVYVTIETIRDYLNDDTKVQEGPFFRKEEMNNVTEKAAYIHIPFCSHICYYCDFNKV